MSLTPSTKDELPSKSFQSHSLIAQENPCYSEPNHGYSAFSSPLPGLRHSFDSFSSDSYSFGSQSNDQFLSDGHKQKPYSYAFSPDENIPYYNFENVFSPDQDVCGVPTSSRVKSYSGFSSIPSSSLQSTERKAFSQSFLPSPPHSHLNSFNSSRYFPSFPDEEPAFSPPAQPSVPTPALPPRHSSPSFSDSYSSFESYSSKPPGLEPEAPSLPERGESQSVFARPSRSERGERSEHGEHGEKSGKRHHTRKSKKKEDVKTTCVSEEVDLGKLERGEDNRSAVMIRNLPNRCTKEGLCRILDTIVPGEVMAMMLTGREVHHFKHAVGS